MEELPAVLNNTEKGTRMYTRLQNGQIKKCMKKSGK